MAEYRPPVYFWIAEFEDGKAIAQFDPDTGKENLFRVVEENQDKLVAFGWHPFTDKLSFQVLQATGIITAPLPNPSFRIELKKGDKLIAWRRNFVRINVSGRVLGRETYYILGLEGKRIIYIREDGTAMEEAA